MKLEDLLLAEGQIPTRPDALWKPLLSSETGPEMAAELLQDQRVAVVGGVSLIGKEGRIVRMVSALRIADGEHLKGWSLSLDADNATLRHIDTASSDLDHNPFPSLMVYFVGELGNADLLETDAPEAEIREIARYVLPFISDEGAPKDIEWDTAPSGTLRAVSLR